MSLPPRRSVLAAAGGGLLAAVQPVGAQPARPPRPSRGPAMGGNGQARTFDPMAGGVGFVPCATSHPIESTGTSAPRFLEVFRSDYLADFPLNPGMALAPQLLEPHLDKRATYALAAKGSSVVPA